MEQTTSTLRNTFPKPSLGSWTLSPSLGRTSLLRFPPTVLVPRYSWNSGDAVQFSSSSLCSTGTGAGRRTFSTSPRTRPCVSPCRGPCWMTAAGIRHLGPERLRSRAMSSCGKLSSSEVFEQRSGGDHYRPQVRHSPGSRRRVAGRGQAAVTRISDATAVDSLLVAGRCRTWRRVYLSPGCRTRTVSGAFSPGAC